MEKIGIFVKLFKNKKFKIWRTMFLLEFDKIGMVELVSEWVFGFRLNYVGFREAAPALTFVDFLE